MKLTNERKADIFRKLATAPAYETGIHFELDKHYSTPKSIRNAIYGIYNQVKNDPQRYGIQSQTVDLVLDAVTNRKIAPTAAPKLAEQIDSKDIKELTLSGRNKAIILINKKLAHLEKSPKALSQVSLPQLGTIFGILFDKGQITQGQATEHIALMGKIDPDMKPEAAIDAVLKMREVNQENIN